MSAPVIVIGAGGHARVVIDALRESGRNILGCTALHGCGVTEVLGVSVIGGDDVLERFGRQEIELAIGIGEPGRSGRRRLVHEALRAAGWTISQVRHPSAVVSGWATILSGAQVMAGAVVQPGAEVREGAVVNTGAIVEHDAVVGRFSHVAPGSILCGGSILGEDVLLGAGAVVRPLVTVAGSVIVGAGAVVVKDVLGTGTFVGAPARPIKGAR